MYFRGVACGKAALDSCRAADRVSRNCALTQPKPGLPDFGHGRGLKIVATVAIG